MRVLRTTINDELSGASSTPSTKQDNSTKTKLFKCYWYSCTIASFKVEMDLYNHIMDCHAKSGANVCLFKRPAAKEPCGLSVRHKGRFADHIVSHLSPDLTPQSCDLCDEKFRSLEILRRHKRNVHPKDDTSAATHKLSNSKRASKDLKLQQIISPDSLNDSHILVDHDIIPMTAPEYDFTSVIRHHLDDVFTPANDKAADPYDDSHRNNPELTHVSLKAIQNYSSKLVVPHFESVPYSPVFFYNSGCRVQWMHMIFDVINVFAQIPKEKAFSHRKELLPYESLGGFAPRNVIDGVYRKTVALASINESQLIQCVFEFQRVMISKRRDFFYAGVLETMSKVKGVIRQCVALQNKYTAQGNEGHYMACSSQTNIYRKLAIALLLFIGDAFKYSKNDDGFFLIELSPDSALFRSHLDCGLALVGMRISFVGESSLYRKQQLNLTVRMLDNFLDQIIKENVWGTEDEEFRQLCCKGVMCGMPMIGEEGSEVLASGSITLNEHELTSTVWIRISRDRGWVFQEAPSYTEPVVQCVY